jgi:chromosomal replication initiator protein
MDPLHTYWPDILGIVRHRVSQQAFDTWFRPLIPSQNGTNGNGRYRVGCPSPFFLDWFSEHHLPILNEAGTSYFGAPVQFNLFVVEGQDDAEDSFFVAPSPGESRPGAATVEKPLLGALPGEEESGLRLSLNQDYTFESFVVGSGTDLVYAAAVAISRKPGEHFNPLFIHGGVGLGKTHLMHAIGNEVLKNRPETKVTYVTAEQFMNDLILSIKQNRTHDFKLRYRSVDVLLVDDVQFLAGKESTQEEFFHTFNALYDDKKQIVLTSDRSPKEIVTLEERLRSRFEWGLITDIQPPDLETRIAILKRKVEVNSIYIPDDVIQYIAENITDNIRRLEGALIRLLAFASLTGCDITLEMASEVLSSFFRADVPGPARISDVIRLVCDELDVTIEQLKSKRRTQDLARARQIAMFLARKKTDASLNQIGRAFGGRDHSTVSHACMKVEAMMAKDPQFRGFIKNLLAKL